MSMLADRKRKQKWSVNPRGADWVNDTLKFGQRMLEKFGWSKGKGLGKNEDGLTDCISVRQNTEQQGIGFKEDSESWTQNEVGFSELLKNLQKTDTDNESIIKQNESLVTKSENSRARLHYKKFTQGKDVARYSPKDLANIFGTKQLNFDETNATLNKDIKEPAKMTDICKESINMIDSKKKCKKNLKCDNIINDMEGISNPGLDLNSSDESKIEDVTKLEGIDNLALDLNSTIESANNSTTMNVEIIEKQEEIIEKGIDNPCLVVDDAVVDQSANVNIKIKKKKKSKKTKKAKGIDNPVFDIDTKVNITHNPTSILKKRRYDKNGFLEEDENSHKRAKLSNADAPVPEPVKSVTINLDLNSIEYFNKSNDNDNVCTDQDTVKTRRAKDKQSRSKLTKQIRNRRVSTVFPGINLEQTEGYPH